MSTRAWTYHDGAGMPCADPVVELARVRAAGEGFVWADLHRPGPEELERVCADLGLSVEPGPLTGARHQVRVQRRGGTVLAVMRAAGYRTAERDVWTEGLTVVVAHQVVLTAAGGELARGVIRTAVAVVSEQSRPTPLSVLVAVIEALVDSYVPVADAIDSDIEEIEDQVFSEDRVAHSSAIYALKREVQEFRRAVHPLSLRMEALHPLDGMTADSELRRALQDVGHWLARVVERADAQDQLLTDALSAHLAQVSVRQNADMRRISAWAAMAAVPTVLAGVYGMNFENMPELHWALGYPAFLVVVVVACSLLWRAFRQSGWL